MKFLIYAFRILKYFFDKLYRIEFRTYLTKFNSGKFEINNKNQKKNLADAARRKWRRTETQESYEKEN